MSKIETIFRTARDVGAAAWFGGTLMGAVGVNSAAAASAAEDDTTEVAGEAWSAWTPVNLAAIGLHLIGGTGVLLSNSERLRGQQGVGAVTIAKLAVTAAALGTTGYSRHLGQRIISAEQEPASDATTPTENTDPVVASAMRQLSVMQWAIPTLTGAIVVLSSVMGEQQRPTQVASGVIGRVADRVPFGG
jgi:hypothetical protein